MLFSAFCTRSETSQNQEPKSPTCPQVAIIVIIVAANLDNEDSASIIEEYIQRNKLKTKLIVLGDHEIQLPQTEVISKRTNWKAATQKVINFLLPDYDEEKIFLKKALKWRKQPESSSF